MLITPGLAKMLETPKTKSKPSTGNGIADYLVNAVTTPAPKPKAKKPLMATPGANGPLQIHNEDTGAIFDTEVGKGIFRHELELANGIIFEFDATRKLSEKEQDAELADFMKSDEYKAQLQGIAAKQQARAKVPTRELGPVSVDPMVARLKQASKKINLNARRAGIIAPEADDRTELERTLVGDTAFQRPAGQAAQALINSPVMKAISGAMGMYGEAVAAPARLFGGNPEVAGKFTKALTEGIATSPLQAIGNPAKYADENAYDAFDTKKPWEERIGAAINIAGGILGIRGMKVPFKASPEMKAAAEALRKNPSEANLNAFTQSAKDAGVDVSFRDPIVGPKPGPTKPVIAVNPIQSKPLKPKVAQVEPKIAETPTPKVESTTEPVIATPIKPKPLTAAEAEIAAEKAKMQAQLESGKTDATQPAGSPVSPGSSGKADPTPPSKDSPAGDSNTTGISNAAQLADEEAGIIAKAPEGHGRSAKDIYEENRHRENYHSLADEIEKGKTLSADDAAAVLAGNNKLVSKITEAKRELDYAIDNGQPAFTVQRLRENYKAAMDEQAGFASKIQKGKSEWSDVGRVLNLRTEIDTGDIGAVLAEARRTKGSTLDDTEIKRLEDLVKEHSTRADDLEKQLADANRSQTLSEGDKGVMETVRRSRSRVRKAEDIDKAITDIRLRRQNRRGVNQSKERGAISFSMDDVRDLKDLVALYAQKHVGLRFQAFVDNVRKDFNEDFAHLSDSDIATALNYADATPGSLEARLLQQNIARLKREAKYIEEGSSRLTKPAQDLRRVRKQIAEVTARIESGDVKSKTMPAPELAKARSELAKLKAQEQMIVNRASKPTKQAVAAEREANKLKKQQDQLDAKIADLQKRLDAGDLATPPGKPKPPARAELVSRIEQLTKLRKELSDRQKAAREAAKPPKPDPETKELERIRKDIADIQARIDAGTPKELPTPKAVSPDIAAARAERSRLRAEESKLRNAVEKGLDLATQAKWRNIQNKIAEVEKRIEDGKWEGTKPIGVPQAIKDANARLAELRKAERDLADGVVSKTKDVKAREKIESQIASMEAQLKSGVFQTTRKPKTWATSDATEAARLRAEATRQKVKSAILSREPKNLGTRVATFSRRVALANPISRAMDLASNLQSAGEGSIFGKIDRAMARGIAKSAGADMPNAGPSKNRNRRVFSNFGTAIKTEMAGNNTKYGGSGGSNWDPFTWAGATDAPFRVAYERSAWSDIADAVAKKRGVDSEAVYKQLSDAEFSEGPLKLTEWNNLRESGVRVADRLTLNNENFSSKLSTAIKGALHQAQKSDSPLTRGAANTLEPVADNILRFTKVIENVARDRINRTPVGLANAILRHAVGMKNPIKMTPDEAMHIAKLYRKGATGSIVTLLAYKYAMDNSESLPGEIVKSEGGKVYADFGTLEQLGGPISPMLLGITMARLQKLQTYEKGERDMPGVTQSQKDAAWWTAAMDLITNQPLFSSPMRALDALENQNALGKYATSSAIGLVPGSSAARGIMNAVDESQGIRYRKAKGPEDQVKLLIPWNRGEVPPAENKLKGPQK